MTDHLKINGHSEIFKRPIFVLGLPRSGTSMVAGLITEFGVWAGDTIAGGPENPKGFFENRAIRENLIKPVLKHMGCDPVGVKILPDANKRMKLVFPTKEGNIELCEKLHRMITHQGYDHAQRWMYKDAKLTLLWRSFLADFPGADWVIVRRKKEGFIKSCLNTSFMAHHSSDPKFWENFADAYNLRLDLLQQKASNVHEIHVEKIFEGDLSQLKSVSDTIGIQFNKAKVNKFVDRKHWHHS
tara:strand:+ start:6247 stop:6972 length:726 start_codon:yes stop_codon:yes gene_type:complete